MTKLLLYVLILLPVSLALLLYLQIMLAYSIFNNASKTTIEYTEKQIADLKDFIKQGPLL